MGLIIKQPIANAVFERPLEDNPSAPLAERARSLLSPDVIGDLPPIEGALRWLLNNEDVHTAIVGTTNLSHLEANVAAVERGPLAAGMVEEMRRRFGEIGAG